MLYDRRRKGENTLGKPYVQELEAVAETYEWARSQDVSGLVESLQPLWVHPLLAVGSGGSLSAAHLAATLHEGRTRNLAAVCTPLEYLNGSEARASAGVLLLSAGGKNPDVLSAFWGAAQAEAPWTTVICGTRRTPLGKLARSSEFASLYEYSTPSGKDGFLATNSLLAACTLLIRAYESELESLPHGLDELLNAPDVLTFFKQNTTGNVRRFMERATVIVLYSPATKTAALDLESKLTEAALARVQLADYRNFAHGRHHWLAKHGGETAILAFKPPEDSDICERTLALVPADVPRLIAHLPAASAYRPLQALLYTFALTASFGRVRGIDPGRPSVPEFGRRLYHLRAGRRKRLASDIVAVAIRRKLRSAKVPPGLADESFWLSCARGQLARFRDQYFEGILFDYDGTLCSSRERFEGPSAELISVLNRLLENGVAIAIATGRGRSVRADLQKRLPRHHWREILIGYYNASDISDLSNDDAPDRSEVLQEPLTAVCQEFMADALLRQTCKCSVRPRQITLEPHAWLRGFQLWERVNERVQRLQLPGVKVVSSTHSVDVIAPGVSKMNLVRALCDNRKVETPERILCIGDRARWPGNDYELLTHTFALSTDEVSADPYSGWNFAPAGCRGTQATRYYFAQAEVTSGRLRLRLQHLSK